jgi:hypothetical protein
MRIANSLKRSRLLLLGLASVAVFAAFAASGAPAADDVAFVVRPDLPVDNLPLAELRRMMLGERQFWSSNLKVTLLIQAPGSRSRDVVFKTIYQMSEAQFRQYWIAKVFRAEATAPPKIVYSNEMLMELSASMPGVLAFLDAAEVPKRLKVLKINGLLPGQPGYPIH